MYIICFLLHTVYPTLCPGFLPATSNAEVKKIQIHHNPSQDDGSFFRAIGFQKLPHHLCSPQTWKKPQHASLMGFSNGFWAHGLQCPQKPEARSLEGRHCSVWGNHGGAGRGGVNSDLVVILVGMFLEGYPRCPRGIVNHGDKTWHQDIQQKFAKSHPSAGRHGQLPSLLLGKRERDFTMAWFALGCWGGKWETQNTSKIVGRAVSETIGTSYRDSVGMPIYDISKGRCGCLVPVALGEGRIFHGDWDP